MGIGAWSETVPVTAPAPARAEGLRSGLGPAGLEEAWAENEFSVFKTGPSSAFQTAGGQWERGREQEREEQQQQDGADVNMLLNLPMTEHVYSYDVGDSGVDTTHPVVRSFVECDDPVVFLERGGGQKYTDAVWGDLVSLLEAAKKEVETEKEGNDGRAVERLRMIWGQMRARL